MPDEADAQLVRAIREGLAAVADPTRAPAMQAYMKSAMPYLGVSVPVVRATVGRLARNRRPSSVPVLRDTALVLWRGAEYREHRYAATELTGLPRCGGIRTPELLPMYAEMVRTGGWWDHTDAIAPQVGGVLRRHRPVVTPQIRAWSGDPDRWLRRLSIICQIGSGADVDTGLLADAIDQNAADPDVFLRKAIGWALRDRARADPDGVRAFLASRGDRLSPLSRREAAKHL